MILASKYTIDYFPFEARWEECQFLSVAEVVRRTSSKASLSTRRFLPIIGYSELTVLGCRVTEDHEPIVNWGCHPHIPLEEGDS